MAPIGGGGDSVCEAVGAEGADEASEEAGMGSPGGDGDVDDTESESEAEGVDGDDGAGGGQDTSGVVHDVDRVEEERGEMEVEGGKGGVMGSGAVRNADQGSKVPEALCVQASRDHEDTWLPAGRERCRYGGTCYRHQNEQHRAEWSHPKSWFLLHDVHVDSAAPESSPFAAKTPKTQVKGVQHRDDAMKDRCKRKREEEEGGEGPGGAGKRHRAQGVVGVDVGGMSVDVGGMGATTCKKSGSSGAESAGDVSCKGKRMEAGKCVLGGQDMKERASGMGDAKKTKKMSAAGNGAIENDGKGKKDAEDVGQGIGGEGSESGKEAGCRYKKIVTGDAGHLRVLLQFRASTGVRALNTLLRTEFWRC
jgi:hypothetical protein